LSWFDSKRGEGDDAAGEEENKEDGNEEGEDKPLEENLLDDKDEDDEKKDEEKGDEEPGDEAEEAEEEKQPEPENNNNNQQGNAGAGGEYKGLDDFLTGLTENIKDEWQQRGLLGKLLLIPIIPVIVLIWLTVPAPDPKKVKKIMWAIYPVPAYFMTQLAFSRNWRSTVRIGDTNVWIFLIALPIVILFAVIMTCFTKDGQPVPGVHSFFSLGMSFVWLLYIIKWLFDFYDWNLFNKVYYSYILFGTIYIGFGVSLRHYRTARVVIKEGTQNEYGLLLWNHCYFSASIGLGVYMLFRYLRWLSTTGVRDEPRYQLYQNIFDSRYDFFMFFVVFAVFYRLADFLTMKWRTNFLFKKTHRWFSYHYFGFFIFMVVVLNNLDFK
jgi:hypothetical protein